MGKGGEMINKDARERSQMPCLRRPVFAVNRPRTLGAPMFFLGFALLILFGWIAECSAKDNTRPKVTATAPASGATGASTTTTVTATFSEAMDAVTINTSTFQLRSGAGTLVSATVSYNATTFVATLTPTSALAGSTNYTATVVGGTNGVKDLAGNALANDRTWSFTTAAVDTTPPTITGVTPSNGATGVATTSSVTATFSEAMTAATINT